MNDRRIQVIHGFSVQKDGFEPLLEAAASRLPGNQIFAPFARLSNRVTRPGQSGQQLGSPAGYAQSLARRYDVFLSYSSRDRDLVRSIAEALRQRGVNPWMDEWDLTFGKSFVEEIQQLLDHVKAVVVFFGADGYGPWQRAEVEVAYDRAVRGHCLLIPMMLPGVSSATQLPGFLRRLHGGQIRGDQRNDEVIDRLAKAILERNQE